MPAPLIADRNEILTEIDRERMRQITKFGTQRWTNGAWMTILIEEVGEVGHELNEVLGSVDYDGVALRARLREELVQVAAVAVAWIEDLDDAAYRVGR